MKFIRFKIFAFVLLVCLAGFLLWRFYHQGTQKNNYNADILITNGEVLTLDGQSNIYNPGWVEIKDGKIINLGEGAAPKSINAKKTIDASGKLVMPGLVNTHSHAAMTLLRGADNNEAFEPWLATTSAFEKNITPDDVYWGSLLAEDEMIRTGTTAFNDMYFFPESTAKAATEAGMCAVLRVPITNNNGAINFDQNIVSQNQNNPLIAFSLAPNPYLDYTPDQLKQISDYALQNNYLVHIHFEEDPQNRADSLAKYNLTPTQLISEAGFLRNKLVLAHVADVNADEMNTIGRYPNVGVSFNPKSEAKLGSALTPVVKMLDSGVTVGIGTDGAASSNSLDMFGQINFAAYGFLKCSSADKFCQNGYSIDPEKIVRMATIDGAKILGLDYKIGSLETGKQADIIILDLQKPGLLPSYDIYSTLVYNTGGDDVTDTIINGNIVMENHQLLTIKEADLIKKVQEISQKFKK
jgi:5-methylthioadenosine/S-adenosylhomocysteine deaminase